MIEFIQNHENLITWFSAASIAGLIISIVFIPWVIIQLPSDYFIYKNRKTKKLFTHHPICRIIFFIFKNLVGIILLLSGMITLFIPGQGILTMIIGIILIDFPYKYKIERYILCQSHILSIINKFRIKANQTPFIIH